MPENAEQPKTPEEIAKQGKPAEQQQQQQPQPQPQPADPAKQAK